MATNMAWVQSPVWWINLYQVSIMCLFGD